MNDRLVWAIDGPVDHSARMAREEKWAQYGGQTGVCSPASLRVTQLDTPGAQVRIMPGAFVAAATPMPGVGYTDAPWQSYGTALYQALYVDIEPNNTSSPRRDVIGIQINDPNFEGTAETVDWDNHEFWSVRVLRNTSASRVAQFALARPFVPLAALNIPASTATITDAMITDLRFLAYTREEPGTVLARASSNRTLFRSSENWQSLHQFDDIQVPQWATHIKLDGEITNFVMSGASGSGEDVAGQIRIGFSPTPGTSNLVYTPFSVWTLDDVWTRDTVPAQGILSIPEALRGQNGWLRFYVRISSGTRDALIVANRTWYRLRYTFVEQVSAA